MNKVRELTEYAKNELNTGVIQLSLAYILAMPNTGTVILGASSHQQLEEQLKVLDLKITPEIEAKVEEILKNKPQIPVSNASHLCLNF